MEEEEKIIKFPESLSRKDVIVEDFHGIIDHTVKADEDSGFSECKILHKTDYGSILAESKFEDIPTIEAFKEERVKRAEEAKLAEERKREEDKIIEEPVDLSGDEVYDYLPYIERKVSYRRTFGRTESQMRDKEKFIVIAIFSLLGLASIFMLIINLLDK